MRVLVDYSLDGLNPQGHFPGMQKTPDHLHTLDYSPQRAPIHARWEPASRIIELFNSSPQKRDGARILSERLGIHIHTVNRWRLAKENGGSGGWVPRKYHDAIIAFALELGVTIAKEDFL